MKINHELVYKTRKTGLPTDSLSNLQIQASNEARRKAGQRHESYLNFLRRELGTDDFEVTNEVCMAEGIIGHVYVGGGPKGLGKRKCCFCGCGDFND